MKKWIALAVAVLLLLTACNRREPTPQTPVSTTTTTTQAEEPLSVVGDWQISLPVDGLLDTAAAHAPSLSLLGDGNVTLLRTAQPFVEHLDTSATLLATLTLREDGTGQLLITKDAMRQTTATVAGEYNPLLKNVVGEMVEGFLPEDITADMTYTLHDTTLTVSYVGDQNTAVVFLAEHDRLLVTGVLSHALSEEDRAGLEKLLRAAKIVRK